MNWVELLRVEIVEAALSKESSVLSFLKAQKLSKITWFTEATKIKMAGASYLLDI